METAMAVLGRLGWHVAFWSSGVVALSIGRLRLQSSWDERCRDGAAADSIVRHFEASLQEGEMLRRSLSQELRRRLESLFHVDRLMAQLERLAGGEADQVRAQRLAIWEEIKLEGKGRTRLASATTNPASPA